ncbi:MAG: hypothetical protein L0G99_00625 [Propionibacteriales bacterium]|nr:hypothetical protein [Propionibacteriales bacterium]
MSTSQIGLLTGLVLGVVAFFGGFGAFLIVLVMGAAGLLVGRWLEGKLDVQALFGRATRR